MSQVVIPTASELRAQVAAEHENAHRLKLQNDVEVNTARRLAELREETLPKLRAAEDQRRMSIEGKGLTFPRCFVGIDVGEPVAYRGDGTVAIEDFGHHHAAATALADELRTKEYDARLVVREDCRVAADGDLLVLEIKW